MSSMLGLVADVVPSSYVDGPGNRFVVFMQGCTFNCLACHNPHTIPTSVHAAGAREGDATAQWRDPGSLVEEVAAVAPFLSGVTISGGEATCQWPFVLQLCWALADHRATRTLTRLVDTNGDTDRGVWPTLAPVIHGAMVDLKALDPEVHHLLTARDNERVLASIVELDQLGKLSEVRLLLLPGVNDTTTQLQRTAEWLQRLTSEPTVAVLGFRHAGTRPVARAFREATADDLDQAVATLVGAGISADAIRRAPALRH
jgi:pyruvate-formate lyase-activating enzyme